MGIGANPVRQRRSEDKRDRLIDALDGLLREKDFDDIRIADIASTAGVSPATIYQRFNRKDAAVSILIELYMRRVREWTASEAGRVDFDSASDLFDALVLIADAAWRQVEHIGYVMGPAYLYSRLKPELLGPTWDRMQAAAVGGFREFLRRYDNEVRSVDPDRAAASLTGFFNMMLLAPLLHPEMGGPALANREAFCHEIATYAHAYLTRPGDESVDRA